MCLVLQGDFDDDNDDDNGYDDDGHVLWFLGCQVPEGSGEQGKTEKTGCKIICGAPTTLAGG